MADVEKLSLEELINDRVNIERFIVTTENDASLYEYAKTFPEGLIEARVYARAVSMEIRKRLIVLKQTLRGVK